ncbi:MAG: hypothetical protein WCP96_14705, partial [Methylococcaceae bacterium]
TQGRHIHPCTISQTFHKLHLLCSREHNSTENTQAFSNQNKVGHMLFVPDISRWNMLGVG